MPTFHLLYLLLRFSVEVVLFLVQRCPGNIRLVGVCVSVFCFTSSRFIAVDVVLFVVARA